MQHMNHPQMGYIRLYRAISCNSVGVFL